ncbi:Uncharacterized protein BM_BM18023 [Brugia malayi]|uniref:Uncharacterized protein n=1 Tax=Brugia malayi TaxID=6279 RepID=A0A4E9F284_BRUMA|nr:Uncharacterized protein BM_BM18023 [Brugia malayi]VIO88570.1 Uncharacterized protein BM_BM18023 [Brugia malayi]
MIIARKVIGSVAFETLTELWQRITIFLLFIDPPLWIFNSNIITTFVIYHFYHQHS